MKAVLELGKVLDREWRGANYEDAVFPRLAANLLAQSDAWSKTTPEEIIESFTSGGDVADQYLDGFGQPNLRVYTNHKFRIELLFWFESTTSIHEHSFSGAFGVLHGSSLHSQYHFSARRRVCNELVLGDLRFRSSELLKRGAVHVIEPGSSYVHSLYHLDYPSVSIVVRTHEDRPHSPQMKYTRPGLAEAAQYDPYPFKTMLALLDATARMGSAVLERSVLSVIRNYDILTAFRAARLVLRRQTDDEMMKQRVRTALAERDPDLADMLERVIVEEQRNSVLIGKRATITDAEQRFLLALLLNVPDRSIVLSLVAERFPDDAPAHKVFSLLVEMSAALDVPLRGKVLELLEAAVSSSDYQSFVTASLQKDAVWDEAALHRAWDALCSVPAFAPLFTTAGS